MNRNSKEFKALREKWYKKLKKSGFADCEDELERLTEYHNFKYSLKDPLAFSTQTRYYELAGQLLHSHSFKSIREKQVWREHCQGLSVSSIARKMGLSVYAVDKIVSSLAELIKSA